MSYSTIPRLCDHSSGAMSPGYEAQCDPPLAVDLLHPYGHCRCWGEGWCSLCVWHAHQEQLISAEAEREIRKMLHMTDLSTTLPPTLVPTIPAPPDSEPTQPCPIPPPSRPSTSPPSAPRRDGWPKDHMP